jgi:excisionase family DNA binding protein
MTRANTSDPVRPAGARLLSTAEVAMILDVSRRSVLEWIGSGDLPAFRIGPQTRHAGRVLLSSAVLAACLAEALRQSAPLWLLQSRSA